MGKESLKEIAPTKVSLSEGLLFFERQQIFLPCFYSQHMEFKSEKDSCRSSSNIEVPQFPWAFLSYPLVTGKGM